MKRFVLPCLFLLIRFTLDAQEAIVKEENITMPTYPFSDPDPVARPGRIYPYFRFDGYSSSSVEMKHRMVTLENRWIKVWVAPDMGGKVWGALDKKNGKYFVYFNRVVKFREIAMRGPWTSGGIEFNFGSIGHAPTTSSPVDFTYMKNVDGSVSCFIGSTDLTSATDWQIEIRLPSDKAWFETHSVWINPTPMKTSLYHWQTMAADATDDLHYVFPGTHYIDHGGNDTEWPVLKDGRNISDYNANDYGGAHSYHVLGCYTDWFAGFYSSSNTGFGHWSRYPYKPGKKIWIWGLSREGEIWKNLLADTASGNTQYTELQTGLLFNQEADGSTLTPFKHAFMMPGDIEKFTEKWFPVSGTGGITEISEEGILNLSPAGNSTDITFQSLEYLSDTIEIMDRTGKLVKSLPLDMEPEKTVQVHVDAISSGLTVMLKHGELRYSSSIATGRTLNRPVKIDSTFDWESVYGIYSRGIEKFRQRLYPEARVILESCIGKDPSFLPALTALADLDLRSLNYDEAEKKLLRVLSFDTYDPEANFLYGNLLSLKGEYPGAKDAYGISLKSTGFKSAALNRLALVALKECRYDEAQDYINDALLYNGLDQNILMTAAVISRVTREDRKYGMYLERLSGLNPLSHFAAFEKFLSSGDTSALGRFRRGINTEFKSEVYTGLAIWYLEAGLTSDAVTVLKAAPPEPMTDYLLAYLYNISGDKASASMLVDRALGSDIKLVFPYRDIYAGILQWADSLKHSWKNDYYLALLWWSKGNNEMADRLFSKCGDEPDNTAFYLSRANFLVQTGSPGKAKRDYRNGFRYSKGDWRPYHLFYEYLVSEKDFMPADSLSKAAFREFPGSYIIATDRAKSLIRGNSYSNCIRLLKKTVILPFEGAGYGRVIWHQANILEAIRLIRLNRTRDARSKIADARLWPENLGVGRPFAVDETLENTLEAVCSVKEGDKKGRERLRKLIPALGKQPDQGEASKDTDSRISEGVWLLVKECGI
ncbi:MAG TPA: DUF5107 domain-containing protein [Bacteroidales bacterium]|nr:DUF5107 domain-containing protein [Bacteroidales bacterium]